MSEDNEKWLTIPPQLRNWEAAPRAELIERIKELEDPWISVETELPTDHRPAYWVMVDDERPAVGYADFTVEGYSFLHWIVDGARDDTVSHWAHISEPKE